MKSHERLILLAELEHEHCHLYHGPGVDCECIRAVNYIILPIGYKKDKTNEIAKRELVIPICGECADALLGDEWTLLYCFESAQSRWVYRAWAKNRYRHHILWLRGCPDCSNKFGGLYFNDLADNTTGAYTLLNKCGCV